MQLSTIQKRRKLLDLTQSELAKLSGVSQSAIAKIERGAMNPSYEVAQQLFAALDSQEQSASVKARDIMTKRVYMISTKDTVTVAVKSMRSNNISQLPVVDRGQIVGLITETGLLDFVSDPELPKKNVGAIMTEAPPRINEDAPMQVLTDLLRYYPLLIVTQKTRIAGVIAKSDLLKGLSLR